MDFFGGNFDPGGIVLEGFFSVGILSQDGFFGGIYMFLVLNFTRCPHSIRLMGSLWECFCYGTNKLLILIGDWGSMIALEKLARQCFTAR